MGTCRPASKKKKREARKESRERRKEGKITIKRTFSHFPINQANVIFCIPVLLILWVERKSDISYVLTKAQLKSLIFKTYMRY